MSRNYQGSSIVSIFRLQKVVLDKGFTTIVTMSEYNSSAIKALCTYTLERRKKQRLDDSNFDEMEARLILDTMEYIKSPEQIKSLLAENVLVSFFSKIQSYLSLLSCHK